MVFWPCIQTLSLLFQAGKGHFQQLSLKHENPPIHLGLLLVKSNNGPSVNSIWLNDQGRDDLFPRLRVLKWPPTSMLLINTCLVHSKNHVYTHLIKGNAFDDLANLKGKPPKASEFKRRLHPRWAIDFSGKAKRSWGFFGTPCPPTLPASIFPCFQHPQLCNLRN